MRFEDYQAIDAVNWSRLKLLDKSPLHYRAALSADSDAFRVGRALHSIILGGQRVVCFDGTRRGKAWDEFQVANADALILSASQHESVVAMADAVRRSPLAAPLLARAAWTEEAIVWREARATCKAQLDAVTLDGDLIDLKTAIDPTPRAFGRIAANYGYHRQLAYYARGFRKVTGDWPSRTLLIAIEKDAPYDVCVYSIGRDVLRAEQDKIDALLSRLWDETLGGRWPGGTPTITALELPAWAAPEQDITVGDLSVAV